MQAARTMIETEELKPKQRQTLRSLLTDFSRWSELIESKPQGELAEIILEESGYTDLWRKERPPMPRAVSKISRNSSARWRSSPISAVSSNIFRW